MTTTVSELHKADDGTLSARTTANIRAEMGRYNVSRADLARLLGLTHQAVSLKIHNKRPLGINELGAIADYLGVSVAYLIGETADPRPGGSPNGGEEVHRLGLEPRTHCLSGAPNAQEERRIADVLLFPEADDPSEAPEHAEPARVLPFRRPARRDLDEAAS